MLKVVIYIVLILLGTVIEGFCLDWCRQRHIKVNEKNEDNRNSLVFVYKQDIKRTYVTIIVFFLFLAIFLVLLLIYLYNDSTISINDFITVCIIEAIPLIIVELVLCERVLRKYIIINDELIENGFRRRRFPLRKCGFYIEEKRGLRELTIVYKKRRVVITSNYTNFDNLIRKVEEFINS